MTDKAVSLGSTLAVTGAVTTTGGVAPGSGSNTVFWTAGGAPTAVATGTDTACSNGDRYWSQLFIPANCTVTGLSYLIGSVGGTDKAIVELHDSTGALLATSATAGTTVGTAGNIQSIAFTAAYSAKGPGLYYACVQFNGTTAKFRSYLIPGSKFIAGTAVGTFGTSAAITPGTTFTADKGPIMATY